MIENFSLNKVKLLASFILSLIAITCANASHLRAGQITVTRPSCRERTVIITITVYTNTASEVKFGEDGILDFGDGTSMIVPRVENTPTDLGTNVGIATFSVRHSYGAVGSYLISYVEPNRNGGVLNMSDSFFTPFYLETLFDLSALGCNNSPQLRIPPIDQACAGVAFYHNPGAYDINPVGPADSLSYELVVPFRDRGTPVTGYVRPDALSVEGENGGPPTFTINQVDGTLVWNAPSTPGEYNIAFNVVEWRKSNGVWKRIGFVRRDMQIIVNGDCKNERPILETPADTCVVAGSSIHKFIYGQDQVSASDPTPDLIKIQAFSQVFEFPSSKSPATRKPVLRDGDVDFRPSPDSLEFSWNTICDHVRGQPYDVVFKISDFRGNNGTPGDPNDDVSLVSFKTWRIKVVAPPPILTTATPQVPQRYVSLNWSSYACSSLDDINARIQIWRRIDETSYTPGTCDLGMPESLGFSLIATVPLTDTQYLDKNNDLGLERGVKYCYRLVAIFPDRGTESPVSNEVCIEPMDIAAPLITRVTVDKTGDVDGEITVRWLPPLNNFEVRPAVDFEDYEYQLERADGDNFISVSPKIAGTTDSTQAFTFTDAGLNTADFQYTYRVMLYVAGLPNPVDSSSLASSVWLTLTTGEAVVDLTWRAAVPWSNQVEGISHIVYIREGAGAVSLDDFTDSLEVDVSVDGFRYRSSEFRGEPLDITKTYCYAVVTKGSYGNDDSRVLAEEPLRNVSQINCAIPVVIEPPCAPDITAFEDPCKDFFDQFECSSTVFSNTVRWSNPGGTCESDIKGYYLFRSSTRDNREEVYLPVTKTVNGREEPILYTETVAVVEGLAAYGNCYRVQAVDRSDRRSPLSDPVCVDGCPYYELPNVFTPNGDKCNDLFSAFGVKFDVIEDSQCETPTNEEYQKKCARFVDRVDFNVFNRWGKKVYDYVGQRGNENSIYINWDGRDSSGKELATGIYFYSADVTFSSTEPGGKTVKKFKGWVHLVR